MPEIKPEQETLPISDAQKRHLKTLMEQQAVAEQSVKTFIAYLRDEHNVGVGDGWERIDYTIGFVRSKQPKDA